MKEDTKDGIHARREVVREWVTIIGDQMGRPWSTGDTSMMKKEEYVGEGICWECGEPHMRKYRECKKKL